MDFRERLREQIEISGLLDKEVAAQAGISKRAIDCYVGSQGCMPAADVAVRLARVLGVTVEYLVEGTEVQNESIVTKKIIHMLKNCDDFDKKIILTLTEELGKRHS